MKTTKQKAPKQKSSKAQAFKEKPLKEKSPKPQAQKSNTPTTSAQPTAQAPSDTIAILRECTPTFSVLADENRLLILQILFDSERINVNELTERLHLSRPAASHHLRLMRDAGLVQVEQVGKKRYYLPSFERAGERFARLMTAFVADGCIDAGSLPKL